MHRTAFNITNSTIIMIIMIMLTSQAVQVTSDVTHAGPAFRLKKYARLLKNSQMHAVPTMLIRLRHLQLISG
jgi:hypothetical protein